MRVVCNFLLTFRCFRACFNNKRKGWLSKLTSTTSLERQRIKHYDHIFCRCRSHRPKLRNVAWLSKLNTFWLCERDGSWPSITSCSLGLPLRCSLQCAYRLLHLRRRWMRQRKRAGNVHHLLSRLPQSVLLLMSCLFEIGENPKMVAEDRLLMFHRPCRMGISKRNPLRRRNLRRRKRK